MQRAVLTPRLPHVSRVAAGWLTRTLAQCARDGERVIVLSHIPLCPGSARPASGPLGALHVPQKTADFGHEESAV